MTKPKCQQCKVLIDKKEKHYYKLYKITKTGNKIWMVYFCDDLCVMDYLLNASFHDDNAWRIEDKKGIVQTIKEFADWQTHGYPNKE